MGDKTGISWTDATWNPVRGCSRVSEGCRHCYAERVAARFSGPGQPYEGLIKLTEKKEVRRRDLADGSVDLRQHVTTSARWNGVVRLVPEHLADPLRWRKPRRIFVNSMSDLFHESLTNEQIAAVFGAMAAAPHHTFQVLTKRAKRMREWFAWLESMSVGRNAYDVIIAETTRAIGRCDSAWNRYLDENDTVEDDCFEPWPLLNVWLGVSVESQAAADERIPELLATPAAVRFLSCEPLIAPVDLRRWAGLCMRCHGDQPTDRHGSVLDWVIAGCESGPGARPCSVDWLRSLRDQCSAAGVAFFLKQAREGCGCPPRHSHTETEGCETCTCTWSPSQHNQPNIRSCESGVLCGPGSKRKPGNVIELPCLDGVQHTAMPAAAVAKRPSRGRR